MRPFDAVDAVDAARTPPPPAPSSAAATSKYPWTAPGDDCCKHKAVWSALFVVAGDAFCAWMSSTRSVVHRKGAVPRFLGSSSSIIVIIERSLPRYCTCHGGGMVYLTTVDNCNLIGQTQLEGTDQSNEVQLYDSFKLRTYT